MRENIITSLIGVVFLIMSHKNRLLFHVLSRICPTIIFLCSRIIFPL